jgi:hypothetical protein
MQTSFIPSLGLLALCSALLLLSSPAVARSNGIVAASCEGCHGSAETSEATLTASPAEFGPGESVTFTLTVRAAGSKAAGVFVAAPGIGQLSTVPGEGLTLSAGGLTHSAPKAMQGDTASFRFTWQAPGEAGAVAFPIYVLGVDLSGNPRGDRPGYANPGFVYGCSPQTFYWDNDGDGYGTLTYDTVLDCSGPPPNGYSAHNDDCAETDDSIFPGAEERCNQKDDDCDGEVDEDSTAIELWPDPDGDGYHNWSGTSTMGCLPLKGYAAKGGDCDSNDPARSPGLVEVCNLIDDNCDARVDERVRPQCGEGWCRRDATRCEPESCTPGTPVPEKCNLLDDDCDGEIDDGELCALGEACLAGSCVVLEGPGSGTGGTGTGTGGRNIGGVAPAAGGNSTGTGAGSMMPSGNGGASTGTGSSSGAVRQTGGQTDAGLPSASPAAKDSAGCTATRASDRAPLPLAGLLALGWLLRRGLRSRRGC